MIIYLDWLSSPTLFGSTDRLLPPVGLQHRETSLLFGGPYVARIFAQTCVGSAEFEVVRSQMSE